MSTVTVNAAHLPSDRIVIDVREDGDNQYMILSLRAAKALLATLSKMDGVQPGSTP